MREIVNNYLRENVSKNDVVVDATIGNGNDTLLLANLASFVYGFDIQKDALNNTKKLLDSNNISNYKLIKDSHLNLYNYLSDFKGVVFNLGYLPKGDKTVTTKEEVTIETLRLIANKITANSFIIMTVYVGHKEGIKESVSIKEFLKRLDESFNVLVHSNESSPLSPYVVIIEKR